MISMPRPQAMELRSAPGDRFREEVLAGLAQPVKMLPSKYFYDETGSELFERITRLDEYYLTRTEISILGRHAAEMAACMGPHCLLIEYGSGSSAKTRLLLDRARALAGYVPIDVSAAYLRQSARALARDYPGLEILPVCGDFCSPLELPAPSTKSCRRVVFFPGSTIGNFHPPEARALLRATASLCGPGGGLLLGADLRKDRHVLEAAYNDALGVTAAFNRNILVHINRALEADFVPEQFNHLAFYSGWEGRIEMHLISARPQRVHVAGETFVFEAGESIRTECSYKYDLDNLRELAQSAGFELERAWIDEQAYFSVSFFVAR